VSGEDPVAWLRQTIEADLELAKRIAVRWVYPAGHQRAGEPIWPNASLKALAVWRRDDPDVRAGLDVITMGSPADVIADREADLAILREHPPYADDETRCARCRNWLTEVRAPWPCTTVRLVSGRYRHRPGYQEGWGLKP
jgi:Family of unknown function (DUF6221)